MNSLGLAFDSLNSRRAPRGLSHSDAFPKKRRRLDFAQPREAFYLACALLPGHLGLIVVMVTGHGIGAMV